MLCYPKLATRLRRSLLVIALLPILLAEHAGGSPERSVLRDQTNAGRPTDPVPLPTTGKGRTLAGETNPSADTPRLPSTTDSTHSVPRRGPAFAEPNASFSLRRMNLTPLGSVGPVVWPQEPTLTQSPGEAR